MFRDSKFLHLYEKLSSRWSSLKSAGVKLSSSLPGDPCCLIQNDEDLEIMLDMMFKPGCHEISVSIIDCGSSSSGSTTYGCSRTSEVLSSFRREWSLDVDKEVDLMPSFCDHRDTVLLSAGWRDLIKEIGQKFVGVVEFREALSKLAIYFGFEYDFIKNDKVRVSAACRMKHSDLACPWMVHGRVDHLSGNFYIRQLTNSHTCGASVLKMKHSRATSSLVGKLVIEDIRSQPLKRPVDVASDLKRLYGVSISYTRELGWEWRKQKPMHLETTLHHLMILDGGLMLLGSQIQRVRHKGCLLAASAKDGNKGLFPVCFAIVDSESKDNWYWFLAKLRTILGNDGHSLAICDGNESNGMVLSLPNTVGDDRNVVFISDRNEGILDGVAKNFPLSPHGYCLYHLKQNLRHALTGIKGGFREYLIHLFGMAAYAPNEGSFNEQIAKLKSYGIKKVEDFLTNAPKDHWACAFFPGKRYGEMSSSLSESFNSWIREEQHLPVTQLVDRIRVKIMEQLSARHEASLKWNQVVCPTMNEDLNVSFQTCKSWTTSKSSVDVYEIHCDPSFSVNIAKRTCSCGQWQFKGFPCCHAVCAIFNSKKQLNLYVDPYFYVSTSEVYSKSIFPIPTLWKPAAVVNDDTILPPLSRKPLGRPRKKRIRSNGENTRPLKCSRCGKIARHNKKTCIEDLRISGS
ncbi:hypothetical protein Vadar_004352 [Vaccinium darrowii]|uniref:Uncharacterized protein n=1 Tax=Vaccinium darrowii TaxID=229202 RepID=A0ACB7XNW5_9ERIC|nr:hypothetical protein Vadar_004352 [Vaccinium darrowii]